MKPPLSEEATDRSLYPRLAARLPLGVIGRAFYPFHSLGSTQDIAGRLAAEGAPEGTVVVADYQTRGRGRLGRSWSAEARANLLVSVLLRPQVPLARLPQLSLVAAVACAEAIREFSGLAVGIQWPNDLLFAGRKVAGILSESTMRSGKIDYAVVGIGVNVNQADFPGEIRDTATSLALELGTRVDREGLLDALLSALDRWYRVFAGEGGGFPPVRDAWRRLSVTLGAEVSASGRKGVALDLDEDGALVVLVGSGEQIRVLCGELQ